MNIRYVLLAVIIPVFTTGCPRSPYGTTLPPPTVRPIQSSYHTAPPKSHITPWTSDTKTSNSFQPSDWIPPQNLEIKSRWKGIIIHHSASVSGNAAEFNRAHQQRGWDGLGYDFVINNGRGAPDGLVEVGYRWRRQEKGAHCHPEGCWDNYWNEHTIGICLVGNFENHSPTPKQWQSLLKLVRFLQDRYQIPNWRIIGHRDVPLAKTKCPGKYLSLTRLRNDLAKN